MIRIKDGIGLVSLLMFLVLPASRVRREESFVVRGRLLGSNGMPMQSGFVRPYGPGQRGSLLPTRGDGTFVITFPRPGGYRAVFGGPFHETLFVPFLLDGPTEVDVEIRLAPARASGPFDSVRVVGGFNGFGVDGAIPMNPRRDGTLVAMVPCDEETLRYQLLGVGSGGVPICGTQADTFIVDRTKPLVGGQSTSFISLLKANRRPVRILFDPALLPRDEGAATVVFSDTDGVPSKVVALTMEQRRREEQVRETFRTFRENGGNPDSFRWDAAFGDLTTEMRGKQHPLLRGLCLLNYFHHESTRGDSTLAQELLVSIPPSSPLWELEWGGPENTLYRIDRTLGRPEAVSLYAERMVETHADSTVQAGSLYYLLSKAFEAGDKELVAQYYSRLMDGFPKTYYAEVATKEFAPNRSIVAGKNIPDFAFANLEDSARVYRASDLRGRYVLLEFWATWCAPCVSEMPYLEQMWRRYKKNGLVILSVSLDGKAQDVRSFGERDRLMPWPQAIVPGGFRSETARVFEIVGIPRAILIDPEGRIVATDADLRGNQLGKTLAMISRWPTEFRR